MEKKKKTTALKKVRLNLNNVEGCDTYSYEFMLSRVVDIVKAHQAEGGASAAFKLIDPQCLRSRTKSTWCNFGSQADALKRKHEHILEYFKAELGCVGNIGSKNEMILHGAYQPKNFTKIIRKYSQDFVQCGNCKGMNTELIKE
tara:strand:- start:54 stop:485 length:432 start_codon:yes stop_codon:yes gene_type:complete